MKTIANWAIAGILCVVVALLALSAQNGSLLERAGFAHAPSFSPLVKNLRVGSQRFQIPSNYIYAPLEVTGRDGDFAIVRGIAAQGLAPDFAPLTPSNEKRFHEPLCCFRVLISPMAVSPDEAMSRFLKIWFNELEVLSKEDDGIVTHYEVRSPHNLILLSQYGDLYINDDHSQAAECNRRDTEGIRHIVNVQCVVYSAQQKEAYEFIVPNNDPSSRDHQLKVIRDVIHSWMR